MFLAKLAPPATHGEPSERFGRVGWDFLGFLSEQGLPKNATKSPKDAPRPSQEALLGPFWGTQHPAKTSMLPALTFLLQSAPKNRFLAKKQPEIGYVFCCTQQRKNARFAMSRKRKRQLKIYGTKNEVRKMWCEICDITNAIRKLHEICGEQKVARKPPKSH